MQAAEGTPATVDATRAKAGTVAAAETVDPVMTAGVTPKAASETGARSVTSPTAHPRNGRAAPTLPA